MDLVSRGVKRLVLTAFGEDLQGNLGPCSGALISCSFPGGNSATLWDACVRPLFFFLPPSRLEDQITFVQTRMYLRVKCFFHSYTWTTGVKRSVLGKRAVRLPCIQLDFARDGSREMKVKECEVGS